MTDQEHIAALTAQLAELSGHVVKLALRQGELEARIAQLEARPIGYPSVQPGWAPSPVYPPWTVCKASAEPETSLQRNAAPYAGNWGS